MRSCYLICIHKENSNDYYIKGHTFDDYLAMLASGRISIYSFVLLIFHDLDSLPDVNKVIKTMETSWVADWRVWEEEKCNQWFCVET